MFVDVKMLKSIPRHIFTLISICSFPQKFCRLVKWKKETCKMSTIVLYDRISKAQLYALTLFMWTFFSARLLSIVVGFRLVLVVLLVAFCFTGRCIPFTTPPTCRRMKHSIGVDWNFVTLFQFYLKYIQTYTYVYSIYLPMMLWVFCHVSYFVRLYCCCCRFFFHRKQQFLSF